MKLTADEIRVIEMALRIACHASGAAECKALLATGKFSEQAIETEMVEQIEAADEHRALQNAWKRDEKLYERLNKLGVPSGDGDYLVTIEDVAAVVEDFWPDHD